MGIGSEVVSSGLLCLAVVQGAHLLLHPSIHQGHLRLKGLMVFADLALHVILFFCQRLWHHLLLRHRHRRLDWKLLLTG